jgi:hypothetical protein
VAQRIAIQYGDSEYAISGRDLSDVVAEIEEGVAASRPTWLEVAIGQGRATPARLLLAPGIPIAVWQVNVGDREAKREVGPVETDAI